mmetsp:Transcript_7156/g.12476  ORF Transcript_7156/g.12476 Transcript_7156/m.12476 type:complete len:226 (-) Transcript_7156:107-784(-)
MTNTRRTLAATTSRNAVPVLEEWKALPDGRLEGKVTDHPDFEDGSIISVSPPIDSLASLGNAESEMLVKTTNGSQYMLRNPAANGADRFFPAPTSEMNVQSDLLPKEEGEEEMSETKKLMQKVKDAGIAGVISYALWEVGFWAISVPVCIAAYRQVTGHWPDFTNQEDLTQLGAEAFAFVNVARFAVPLRIGLALGTTPWIQTNIVDRFSKSANKQNAGEDVVSQ